MAEQRGPFGPVPLQNPRPYYGPLRPCAPHRYSGPYGFCRLGVSLYIGATGSHVPYKSLIRLRAAYMPDAARAVFRTAPELVPRENHTPSFDIVYGISTRHQRFAFARLSGPYLTGCCPAFCCNAAESARGVSPRAAHRSGLDTLASSGSCHRTKAAASRRELELLLLPVGSLPTSVTCPLRSTSITPASSLLRGSPPLSGASALAASRLEARAPFPLAAAARFSRSVQEPD